MNILPNVQLSIIYWQTHLIFCRVDDIFPGVNSIGGSLGSASRQATSPSIFDQHLDDISNSHIWLLPLGILTVGLRYHEELFEYFGLIAEVLGKILESLTGKWNSIFITGGCIA